eukprot:CAMPEP_0119569582 /NCGR_PEP_ID=MMETSP1352-20130426/42127_1 /TAXON_ID=265584 /ORGANISM="Stauroneis constricta, Strain CCMP1120" /LENGTH=184 /DNA_ID=CAMNT_0007619161 /DNA_START=1 /DNA_END=551 /DNA_ORIENTATION=+
MMRPNVMRILLAAAMCCTSLFFGRSKITTHAFNVPNGDVVGQNAGRYSLKHNDNDNDHNGAVPQAPPINHHFQCSTILSATSKNDESNSNSDQSNVAEVDDASKRIYEALATRQTELENGIGVRYITRTQKGFLNIHHEPSDPFATHNIVGELKEGQIVRSVAPARGGWVKHDAGGWSITRLCG